jgi:hypothetical protein
VQGEAEHNRFQRPPQDCKRPQEEPEQEGYIPGQSIRSIILSSALFRFKQNLILWNGQELSKDISNISELHE